MTGFPRKTIYIHVYGPIWRCCLSQKQTKIKKRKEKKAIEIGPVVERFSCVSSKLEYDVATIFTILELPL